MSDESDNKKNNDKNLNGFDNDNINDINIGYPTTDDPNFQEKIYKKREFYYYKIPERPDLGNYEEIKNIEILFVIQLVNFYNIKIC
jgi:hypothetical protein